MFEQARRVDLYNQNKLVEDELIMLQRTRGSLIIRGDTSTGKSRLVKSFVLKAIDWKMSISYLDLNVLLKKLTVREDNTNRKSSLEEDLLVIDDMCTRIMTTTEINSLLKYLSSRRGKKPTIFIMNLKSIMSIEPWTRNILYTKDVILIIISVSKIIDLNDYGIDNDKYNKL